MEVLQARGAKGREQLKRAHAQVLHLLQELLHSIVTVTSQAKKDKALPMPCS